MTSGALLDLWRNALSTTIAIAAPFLVAGLVIGLAVAILQTATQLQESVLTFVPKLAVAMLVLALAGHWMLDRLGRFATEAFTASAPASAPTALGSAPPTPTP